MMSLSFKGRVVEFLVTICGNETFPLDYDHSLRSSFKEESFFLAAAFGGSAGSILTF